MGRAADTQSWRRAKTEEAYTNCIRAILQVLDMPSQLLREKDGRLLAVLSREDQPKYFAAVIDMRHWLSVVLIFASARSLTVLRDTEQLLASEIENLLSGGPLVTDTGLVRGSPDTQ